MESYSVRLSVFAFSHLYSFSLCTVVLLFFNPHLRMCFIDFRERGREREIHTDIDLREKDRSVSSYMHLDLGLNPQPRYVPWLGIEPTTFWCMGWCSNQLSHLVRHVFKVHPGCSMYQHFITFYEYILLYDQTIFSLSVFSLMELWVVSPVSYYE